VPADYPASGFRERVFSGGLIHMEREKRISLTAACREIGGYPELLFNLARKHDLGIHMKGRARYVNREDLEPLAKHVREWLNRPRMSRLMNLADRPAKQLTRRRGKASRDEIGGGS
jgi:hypothetical protein